MVAPRIFFVVGFSSEREAADSGQRSLNHCSSRPGNFSPSISYLMLSLKNWASTAVWLLLALPFVHAQNTAIAPVKPKWEFGLRGGVGFSSIQLDNRLPRTQIRSYSGGRAQYEDVNKTRSELYIGGYATRYFGTRWSLRSELSLISQTNGGMSLSAGIFPRYRLTNWLNLEAGFESRLALSYLGKSESRFSIGTAISHKDMEFNFRFAPVYRPTTIYGKGAWTGAIQVGASFKLAKIGKGFGSKRN